MMRVGMEAVVSGHLRRRLARDKRDWLVAKRRSDWDFHYCSRCVNTVPMNLKS